MAHFEALWILWTTPAAGLQRQEPGVEDLATLVWFYSQGVHRICEATFQVYCVSGPVFFAGVMKSLAVFSSTGLWVMILESGVVSTIKLLTFSSCALNSEF